MSCIFCDISSGKAVGSFVYRDAHVFGMMSLEQPNPYKVLIIPHDHVETLYDLSDAQAAAVFQSTVRVARAIRDVSGCEGLNLVQANGRVGQQDVFHFHLHLVPRHQEDGIVLKWDNTVKDRETLDQLAGEIRSKIHND